LTSEFITLKFIAKELSWQNQETVHQICQAQPVTHLAVAEATALQNKK